MRSSARRLALGLAIAFAPLALMRCGPPMTGVGGGAPVMSPLLGFDAPPLRGRDDAGQVVDIGDLRGRWVVVNFFASWCAPCRKEFPVLARFADRHRDRLTMIGVIYHDSEPAARGFARRHGAGWPIVNDRDDRMADAYLLLGLPFTAVISPAGTVEGVLLGGVREGDLDEMVLEETTAP